MRLVVVCLVLIATSGCGTSDSPSTAVDNNERTVGNPAVYARIDSMTSCTSLQREFDIAGDNTDAAHASGDDATIPMSYMNAADNRMREVGCYG